MGRDGCPRALGLRGVAGRADRLAVASAIRHGRGGAGRWVADWVTWTGSRVLRGGPDRVRALPGGGRGGDRLPGDRAIKDAASVGRSQQVRSPQYRPVVAAADGRRPDADRSPVPHVRGGEGPGQGARAGQARCDALPASALESCLLRHGRVWDRTAWNQAHRQWLAVQTFEHQNTELAFIDNLAACDGLSARCQALEERLSWVALAAPPLPRPSPDARAQKAQQRDHRRARTRARLLPVGRRHRSLTQTHSPLVPSYRPDRPS